MWTRILILFQVATIAAATVPSVANAQPGKHEDPLSWDRNIKELYQRYCYRCHNEEQTRGDVNLAADTDPRLILQAREKWETALLMVEGEEMPPPDQGRIPSEEERKLMVRFLQETLTDLNCEEIKDPGPPPLRRLNRTEYDNVIQDLTGLTLSPAKDFPPDTSSYGFDNIGPALTFTPLQVEQYHSAAQKVIRDVIDERDSNPKIYADMFGESENADIATAQAVIQQFADRAFRRPADNEYVDKLVAIYEQSRAAKEDHQTALGHAFTGILMAPQFLMRVEQNQPKAKEPYRVDDFELASRLSFFIWSRGPDAELLSLAGEQKLNDPEILKAQTLRMLADDRSRALVKNFFGQWLSLRELESYQPDKDIFPEFDAQLRGDMQAEVEGLLQELIQADRPITDMIDSNYLYLNKRLADHYGIEGVNHDDVRRVEISDRRRGGLLTSAAVLMLRSDPNRTNVPRRGNYIADRILGDAPPPPPPEIPPLEDVAGEEELPLRELLEKHRSSPACAGCHSKIDPLGFSLQNFDAIGRWRLADAGKPIDSSGKMPDGTKFTGPAELKDVLLKRKDAFVRTFAKNLLIYALGRGLETADDCVVHDIELAATDGEDRFSSIVLAIVNSRPFLYRRNPEY
jgi:mono/diheme cytochrome c family protein